MKCKICEKEFTPKFSRAVTCGHDKCKKANYILNRDKRRVQAKPSSLIGWFIHGAR